jgi:hypothetical protein
MARKRPYNEDAVKKAVKKVLASYSRRGYIYSYWPVPAGYGASSLDCICCVAGQFVAIETKAPGEVPTERQAACIRQMRAAGGRVFVIDSVDTRELEEWLDEVLPGDR